MILLPLNSSSIGYCTVVEEVVGICGVILGNKCVLAIFGNACNKCNLSIKQMETVSFNPYTIHKQVWTVQLVKHVLDSMEENKLIHENIINQFGKTLIVRH